MSTHHGKSGVVKIATATVAEVTQFSFKTDVEFADDTVMGDTWKTQLVGQSSWDGSLACFWDEGDANGQELLVSGAEVALNLYPEGAANGSKYFYGQALIKEVTITVQKDAVVTREFTFTGQGVLTLGTAS